MSASRHDQPLQPIALRTQEQLSQGAHPFEGLRGLAHEHRAQANSKVEELGRVLTSVCSIYEQMSILESRIQEGIAHERVPETFLKAIQVILVTMPDVYQELHQLLTEIKGVEQFPQLHTLKDNLRAYCGSRHKQPLTNFAEVKDLLETPRRLASRYAELENSFRVIEKQINSCRDFDSRRIFGSSLALLEDIFEDAFTNPKLALNQGKLKGTVAEFKKCAADAIAAEPEHSILQALHRASQDTLLLARQSSSFFDAMDRFADRTMPLVSQLERVVPPETSAMLEHFNTEIKPHLVDATVKSEIARYVDPRNSSVAAINVDRWIPPALKAVCAGVSVNSKGELIALTETADPHALITAVATLIDTQDPSLYREGHINNRLAPVIRAALPEAHERAASWAAKRVHDAEQYARHERAKAQAARDALEFVELFFDDTLGASLPAKGPATDHIRSTFVTLYTDPELIETRQNTLKSIALYLSIPEECLTGHYECYLLTDRELERWSKRAQRLKAHMLKSANPADYLALHDPSNFLPSALPELLKRFIPDQSDIG